MGRLLLLTLALAACAPSGTRFAGDDGHGDLTCTTCHRGGETDLGMAAVPEASCLASGCHSDLGPNRVESDLMAFEHRDHGGDSIEVALGCVGCHTHGDDAGALFAGADACAVCHADDLDGDSDGDCQLCHTQPDHVAFTSQLVALPHDQLPQLQQSCVRCHYDVEGLAEDTPSEQCLSCHLEGSTALAVDASEDEVHETHEGKACVSCHASELHRSTAMSSAVQLDCLGCHARPHDVIAMGGETPTIDCNDCHTDSHVEQQRMLLGTELPAGADGAPSEKFMDGLTCRSCHVASTGSTAATDVRGSARGCTGCHRSEYATVLSWWRQGGDQRVALARRYLDAARSALGGTSGAAADLLGESEELLDFVTAGGPQHNIPLSHDLLDQSLQRSAAAYREAGRQPPEVPSLGRRPRMGICSYCHYRTNDPWTFSTQPADFHQEVMARAEPPS